MQEKLEKRYHDKIHQLIPVNGLSPLLQEQLVRQAEVVMIPAGNSLFEKDKKSDSLFYLIDGDVDLFKGKDFVKTISASTEHPKVAINQNVAFSGIAKSRVVLMMVKRSLIESLVILDGNADLEKEESIDWMSQLLASEFFTQIPPVNRKKVFKLLDSMIVKKGDQVITQNMAGNYFYVIREGRCVVTRHDFETNETITLAELEPGDCFGEEALISDQKRTASVTMFNAGQLMRLARKDYDELIKQPLLNMIDFKTASSRINEGAKWLDVRFKDEYLQYRLKDSLNIPFGKLEQALETLSKDKVYLVCCDTGVRSSVAVDLLRGRGFDASYLEGGLQQHPEGTDMSDKWLDGFSDFLRNEKTISDIAEEKKEPSDINASMGVQIMEVDRRIRNLKELFNTEKTLAQDLLENSLSEKQSPEDIKLLIEARKRIDQIGNETGNDETQNETNDSGANELRVLRKQLETAQNHIQEERGRVSRDENGSKKRELTLKHVSDELETIKSQLRKQESFELKRHESFENQLATERKKVREQLTRFSSGLARQQSQNMEVTKVRQAAALETRQIIERFKGAHQQYRLRQQKIVQNVRVQLQKQAAEVIAKARQAQMEKVQALTSLHKVQKQLEELRQQRSSLPSNSGKNSEVPLLVDVESIGDEIDKAKDKFLEADAALSLAKSEKRQNQNKLEQMNKDEKRIRHELVEWIASNKQLNLERNNLTDEQRISLDRVRKIAHEALEEAFTGNSHRPGNSGSRIFKNYK